MPKKKLLKRSGALIPAAATASSSGLASMDPADGLLYDNPVAADAVTTFVNLLGGRIRLTQRLLCSPAITPPIKKLLTFTLDPRFDAYSLAQLAEMAKISPGEVLAAFRDAEMAQAYIHAVHLVVEKTPNLVIDLLKDAERQEIECPICHGMKTTMAEPSEKDRNPRPEICYGCNGTGTLTKPAKFETQKLLLELIGVIRKNAPMQVNLNQNQVNLNGSEPAGGSSSAGLAQLQQAVSGILFGRQITPSPLDTIDVTPEPASLSSEAGG